MDREPSHDRSVTNVVCIKHGVFYGPEYVLNLYRAIKKHSTVPFRFVCFSDRREGLKDEPAIETWPLAYNLQGWWNKIPLFAPPVMIADDQIVAIDLDVVITANIDWLLKWRGKFAGLSRWYDSAGDKLKYYNGSLWSLMPGENSHVWRNFNERGYEVMKTYYSDQEWISEQVTDGEDFNELYPGKVLGFRRHFLDLPEEKRRLDEKASMYIFHGFPKPKEMWKQVPWIRENWTI